MGNNDTITRIDGESVATKSFDEVCAKLSAIPVGRFVALRFLRSFLDPEVRRVKGLC